MANVLSMISDALAEYVPGSIGNVPGEIVSKLGAAIEEGSSEVTALLIEAGLPDAVAAALADAIIVAMAV
jgi:hypothetical protein